MSRETTIIPVQEESIQLKTTVPDRNGTSSIAQERNTPMNSRNKTMNSDLDKNDGFGTDKRPDKRNLNERFGLEGTKMMMEASPKADLKPVSISVDQDFDKVKLKD